MRWVMRWATSSAMRSAMRWRKAWRPEMVPGMPPGWEPEWARIAAAARAVCHTPLNAPSASRVSDAKFIIKQARDQQGGANGDNGIKQKGTVRYEVVAAAATSGVGAQPGAVQGGVTR